MRYYVKLSAAAEPMVVDVHDLPNGALEVVAFGRKVDADVIDLGEQLSVRVDGKVVDLTTEGAGPTVGIIGRGYRNYVEVESERQRAANSVKKGGGSGGDNLVRAPMPGRIVKILVNRGDTVAAGQPLLVMEDHPRRPRRRGRGRRGGHQAGDAGSARAAYVTRDLAASVGRGRTP